MTTRRQAREAAFQFLYQNEISPVVQEGGIDEYFSHFSIPADSRDYSRVLIEGTRDRISEIDQKLEKHLANWKISRLSAIDRSLLRLGAYELLYSEEVPNTVTLDELIEIAKRFSESESSSLINGVLDSIAHDRQN